MIGKKVSHYAVTEEIGRGGMGVVYRAHDERLDRDVALKFLPPNLTSDTSAKERFVREARAASSLDHQNICTIYDVGEEDGQTYIVMAYYEGRTLKSRIEDGPMSLEDAVNFAVQIADGLAAAHRKGIVHRDIKPGNIIVTAEGVAKILDFGLAKLAGTKVELTAQDSTLGTAAYMSPEQARGEDIGAGTDVWSLGVILYEMLAGKRPFAAEYEQALLYGILNEEPEALAVVRPDVPADVSAVVERALTKDPAERYSEANDLAADLRSGSVAVASAVGIPVQRRAGADNRKLTPVIAAAVAAVVIVAAFVLWLMLPGGEDGSGVERSVIAVMPFTVQGDSELQYLETGMVDLLSRKLDGAASLRGVDPNALLGRLGNDVKGMRDPGEARELAASFGAGQFILGSVTKIGGSIQLNASLYDTDGSLQTEAETTAHSEEQLMSSIDQLAQLVIADQLGATGQSLDQTAATTTRSLPALRAFLEGERAMTEGRFADAEESLRNAASIDSTFALAWYRLRDALGWNGTASGPDRDSSLARAERYKERLPAIEQRMIEAERATEDARFVEARSIYEDVIRQEPDNVVAYLKLGDLIFHGGDREGFPAVRAREYFETALSLNPENREGQEHLLSIAAKLRDSVAIRSAAAYVVARSTNPVLDIGNQIAQGSRAQGAYFDEIKSLSEKSPVAPFQAAAISAMILEDFDEALKWIEIAADSPIELVRQQARGTAAFMMVAKGKIGQATDTFRALAKDAGEGRVVVIETLLALTPYAHYTADELIALRARVASADISSSDQNVLPNTLRGQEGAFRHALLGLISFRQEDMASLDQSITALEAVDYTGDAPDLSKHYAALLKALHARKTGDRPEALKQIEAAHIPVHWNSGDAPVIEESFNRWVKAETLWEERKLKQALEQYESLAGVGNFLGILYLGPSYLRRGEIYEELGDSQNAIDFYSRTIDLWQDADAPLQPFVEQARAGRERVLDRLASEPS